MVIHCTVKVFFLSVATIFTIITQTPSVSLSKSLIIATANTGGTYYPVGVAISTLINAKMAKNENLLVTAINTAGSGENVRMLNDDKCDLAMLSGLYGVQAFRGLGPFTNRPMKKMAAVAMLWHNVEHFVLLTKHTKNGDLSDLKGVRGKFSIGKHGSGTEWSTRAIFDALGVVEGLDFQSEYLGYDPAITAIIENRIVGAALPAGPPVAAVTKLFSTAGNRATLLNITDSQLNKINNKYNLWKRHVIKAGTYSGQNADVKTMSYPNLLVASNRLSEEEVYKITKCIFENLPFLVNSHDAIKEISLERAVEGMLLPIHPGAAKYYREMGLTVPKQP